MKLTKYCLALDLKDDPQLIEEYDRHHRNVWPEILKSLSDSGIVTMEIYRIENRLFMTIEAKEEFSFEKKEELDRNNNKVQEWEKLMWNYQQAIPSSKQGEKWRFMKKIFDFKNI